MTAQEGYSERTIRSCGLCKYHKQHMRRSGMQPLYHHFCTHPDKVQEMIDRHNRVLADITQFLDGPDSGMFIGQTSDTPNWCPFIPKNKEEGGKEQ